MVFGEHLAESLPIVNFLLLVERPQEITNQGIFTSPGSQRLPCGGGYADGPYGNFAVAELEL